MPIFSAENSSGAMFKATAPRFIGSCNEFAWDSFHGYVSELRTEEMYFFDIFCSCHISSYQVSLLKSIVLYPWVRLASQAEEKEEVGWSGSWLTYTGMPLERSTSTKLWPIFPTRRRNGQIPKPICAEILVQNA